MSKKSHRNRNRAVFLVELSKMTDKEIENLGLAMPGDDPRFPAVYQEYQKRRPGMIKKLIESAPASLSKEDAEEIVKDLTNPATFHQFLDSDEKHRANFNQLVAGDDEALDQVVSEINDRHAARN